MLSNASVLFLLVFSEESNTFSMLGNSVVLSSDQLGHPVVRETRKEQAKTHANRAVGTDKAMLNNKSVWAQSALLRSMARKYLHFWEFNKCLQIFREKKGLFFFFLF